MAGENEASKLAKGVARSATPVGMFEQIGDRFDPMQLIQLLRQMVGGQQAAPPLDAPLPRWGGLDEQGQPIIIPPGTRHAPGGQTAPRQK